MTTVAILCTNEHVLLNTWDGDRNISAMVVKTTDLPSSSCYVIMVDEFVRKNNASASGLVVQTTMPLKYVDLDT